jgi:hypothetical protein
MPKEVHPVLHHKPRGQHAKEAKFFLLHPEVLHALCLLMGLTILFAREYHGWVVAVVASLTVGLFLALIVQDRAETHDSIMGYLPYEIWAPLAVGVCGACGVGVMAYLLRGLAAIILNACIASLLFAAVVRMGDPDLVAPYDTVVFGIFGVWFFACSIMRCQDRRWGKYLLLISGAWLGSFLAVAGLGYFIQGPLGVEQRKSMFDDLGQLIGAVMYGYCGHAPIGTHPAFDAQVHTEKEKPQPVRCQCHEKCRVQYACWVGLANLTLCFYCLAARYSAAERDGYESVTPRPGKLGKVALEVDDDLDDDEDLSAIRNRDEL